MPNTRDVAELFGRVDRLESKVRQLEESQNKEVEVEEETPPTPSLEELTSKSTKATPATVKKTTR